MPTHDELIACVAREVRMRERVYPGWVARERMSAAAAAREIETMNAVLAYLTASRPPGPPPAPPPQGDLFAPPPLLIKTESGTPGQDVCTCGLSRAAHGRLERASSLPEACPQFTLARVAVRRD